MVAASTTYKNMVSSTCYHIHDDIDLSILSKLPIKSLTRFTCVKKSWSLLFQNLHFMDMFRNNFLISKHDKEDDNTQILLKQMARWPFHTSLYTLSGEKFENGVWPPPLQENDAFIRILCSASVNGILCISQESLHDHVTIVLWNPATGEYKLVPHSHQPYENIEFNPCPLAFGYDHVTDDYKVIRIAQYPIYFEGSWICLPDTDSLFWKDSFFPDDDDIFWEGWELRVYDEPFWEIYSLKNNSWRKLDGIDDPIPGYCEVNLNESCHWLGTNNEMVSFDFRDETFLKTTLPSFDLSNLLAKNLVVLNGCVAFICTLGMAAYFHIWILGEVGVEESWTKLCVVGPLPCIKRPLVAGIKSVIFYLKEDDGIAWFDLSTQTIDEIGIKAESAWLQIVIYKENPFSVGGMNN